MAQTALPAPRTAPRRRAMFGLFDADGWGWASAKALFWFVVIIALLGYIPDRAYYFTVGRTVELWPFSQFLHWAPINLCPPENRLTACPVPAGATLPWDISPAELRLPEGRTDGAGVIVGTRTYYIGGTDGTNPSADVFVAQGVGEGNITPWAEGPALPEPRVDPAVVAIGNSIYVVGGSDAAGEPTTTTYRLEVGGEAATWEAVEDLALPEPRTGATLVQLSDGLMLAGGADANGPVGSVWRATQDDNGVLAPWEPQNPLAEAVVDPVGAHVGDFVYVVGGRNAEGPVGAVQVLRVAEAAVDDGHGGTTAAPAEGETEAELPRWGVSNEINLPEARANAAGFTINGVLYVIGGTDGSELSNDVWWTIPRADGFLDGWKELEETNLGSGVAGASAVASGAHAYLLGGTADGGVTGDLARANLAPQDPFFQLGVLGATVPGLRIEGEIGQQLGYLNAATVGAVNFILLILIGLAYNYPDRTRALWYRVRRRGRPVP